MVRMMLAVFAWPLVVALVASAVLWYRAEFPGRTADNPLDSLQLQAARSTAERALGQLRALPPVEQARLVSRLRASLQPAAAWIEALDSADHRVVCLGEQHESTTRRFLAGVFLPRYRVDTLLIEATPEDLTRIERWLAEGRDHVPLLGADIGAVIRSARAHNPAVDIRGIEETPAQARARSGNGDESRDRSLAHNFRRVWQPDGRNAILFGALHCADESTWLYRLLREGSPPRADVPMRNMRIIGTAQHKPTRAFVNFLHALGMGKGDFVIDDTGTLPAALVAWFPFFEQEVLSRYETLVVFREHDRQAAKSGPVVRRRDAVMRDRRSRPREATERICHVDSGSRMMQESWTGAGSVRAARTAPARRSRRVARAG